MDARVFKTAWMAKAARKALISDDELVRAACEAMRGQADDLGGGVFKKRLHRNLHRSILLARGRKYWVFVYLFAKSDRANIAKDELAAFRDLATLYARKTDHDIAHETASGQLTEIWRGDEPDV